MSRVKHHQSSLIKIVSDGLNESREKSQWFDQHRSYKKLNVGIGKLMQNISRS